MITALLRPASKEDAQHISELFLISSEGIAEYIWSTLQSGDESLIDVGTARYSRENTEFSYQNCVIAEVNGEVAGMAHRFVMEASDYVEEDPVLKPYSELEDPGSLYLSGLATYPQYRSQGLGSLLLDDVIRYAIEQDIATVSLIVFEMNDGACRLYERYGFQETDRRPIVPHPLFHYDQGDAILLRKSVN